MSRADIIDRPPGHARILGSPRSGKTSLLVERFHHLEKAGHHPLVIAFGRDQRDRLLERLIPAGTARFGPTPVTTHGLLASRLISASRPNRPRTLRDVDETIVLDRVLAAQPDLLRSDLRSISTSSTLRDSLLRIIHLLTQNGLGADAAEAVAKKSRDARARDILNLFAAYQRHLKSRNLVTFYDASWEAARVVAEDASLCETAGVRDVVLVDDFQDLDAGQFALLQALAPPDGSVALEVFGDPTGSRFSFRGTSDRFLASEFSDSYAAKDFRLEAPVPTDAALLASVTAFDGSGRSAPVANETNALPLFANASAPKPDGPDWRVHVHAIRARDEVAEAQQAALQAGTWIEQGIDPGEIVVVARDPERIASLVLHAFRERGVPIDVGPRADSAVDAFVHALVGAMGRDSDGQFAGALETSPLMRAFCQARELPADVTRAVATLRKQYASRDGFDFDRLVHECLVSLGPASVIERVSEEWSRYAEVVGHAGGSPSLDEFRRIYLDAASMEQAAGNTTRLLSARAVSGHTSRAAIILGCADGIFPRVDVESGFLPLGALASILESISPGAAHDIGVRIDRDHAEREETALLHSALMCANDELIVSHPRKSGDQKRTIPTALAPLFENAADVDRDESAGFRASAIVSRAASDATLSTAARDIDRIAGGWLAPPLETRRPTFEQLALSPSRLDTFTKCERKFFYQRILRIEEPGSIYLEIGSVFHEVMKDLVEVGATRDDVRQSLQSSRTTEAIDRAISKVMPDAGDWVRALTEVHILRMLDGVRELEEKRNGEYRVAAVETAASFPADGDAILTGRLDRVDDVEGLGPVVVDYKTSKSISKSAASILKEIEEYREHWQVTVYSALAGAMGHNVEGFLYYVVPPGEKVNAVGLQLAAGRLVELVSAEGRERPRYDILPSETLRAVLDDAMKIHADVLAGACAYERTEDRENCRNCHFIRVCRRTAE